MMGHVLNAANVYVEIDTDAASQARYHELAAALETELPDRWDVTRDPGLGDGDGPSEGYLTVTPPEEVDKQEAVQRATQVVNAVDPDRLVARTVE